MLTVDVRTEYNRNNKQSTEKVNKVCESLKGSVGDLIQVKLYQVL